MPPQREALITGEPSPTGTDQMDAPWDAQRLAEYLKALANPNRLELLNALRVPQPVRELQLHPGAVGHGENPERRISQQAVRDHLARLRAIGVIRVRRGERDGAVVDHFVLDHQKLFAIVEELRTLGELRAEDPPRADPTLVRTASAPVPQQRGPHLVLVRGQNEGRVFALQPARRDADRGWIIGRRPGLAVALDYDPFVSSENAEIVETGSGHSLIDLRSSRNGTWRNFERLERGADVPLHNGDIITVGRTNLVFRT